MLDFVQLHKNAPWNLKVQVRVQKFPCWHLKGTQMIRDLGQEVAEVSNKMDVGVAAPSQLEPVTMAES